MPFLVEKSRLQLGRNAAPSYIIIDSQRVKTTTASACRGIDGGKKIKGCKGPILIDTQVHLLEVTVHAANIYDTVSGCEVFRYLEEHWKNILPPGVLADGGYRKIMEAFVEQVLKKTITISQRITSGWSLIAKRWIVEYTFAWFNHFRRLSKDYEIVVKFAENMVIVAHTMLLLKRLNYL